MLLDKIIGILVLQQICNAQNKTGPIMGQNVSHGWSGSNLLPVKKQNKQKTKTTHQSHPSIMPTKAAGMALSPG